MAAFWVYTIQTMNHDTHCAHPQPSLHPVLMNNGVGQWKGLNDGTRRTSGEPGFNLAALGPHVHFPGTVLNDQCRDLTVAEALDKLASRSPQIEAVGVTDYCTTRGFHAVAAEWSRGFGSNIAFPFPNVEFRLDTATTRAEE